MWDSAEQPQNVRSWMYVMPGGMLTSSSLGQWANALGPRALTEPGRCTAVKHPHEEKAWSPMAVTDGGTRTLRSSGQPSARTKQAIKHHRRVAGQLASSSSRDGSNGFTLRALQTVDFRAVLTERRTRDHAQMRR